MCVLALLFIVSWVLVFCVYDYIMSTAGNTSYVVEKTLTNIAWAHAVNDKDCLHSALDTYDHTPPDVKLEWSMSGDK